MLVKDKRAVVTGGASGIGEASAKRLAREGARVAVLDVDEAKAKAVLADAEPGRHLGLACNVADSASVDAAFAKVEAAFGGVDILVNNAALMVELGYQTAVDVPIAEWNKLLAVNLTGALNCVQAVVPMMRARGGGRIVNQVSGGAFPAESLYGVSKLALVGLTTTLARQLGREKITANAIAPGNVTSDAGKLLTPDDSPFIKFLEATVYNRVRGQPDDLVGPLLLLCSDAGDWITGQTLHVDGGWVVRP